VADEPPAHLEADAYAGDAHRTLIGTVFAALVDMSNPMRTKDPEEDREPQRRQDDEEASLDESKVSRVTLDDADEEDLAEDLAENDLEDLATDDAMNGEGPDA
jgi:hypothetical protein